MSFCRYFSHLFNNVGSISDYTMSAAALLQEDALESSDNEAIVT
jgi:hypothetical protein